MKIGKATCRLALRRAEMSERVFPNISGIIHAARVLLHAKAIAVVVYRLDECAGPTKFVTQSLMCTSIVRSSTIASPTATSSGREGGVNARFGC